MKTIIRKDEEAVSPVIATILMVAITVVLAAVLYVMVSGLLTGPGTNKPVITFGQVTLSGTMNSATGTASFIIADTSQSVATTNYRFNLKVNGTFGSAKPLGATGIDVTIGPISGVTYTVSYTDVGGDQTVNGGDTFAVKNLRSSTSYVFVLLWSDGSQIQSREWSTS